MIERDPSSPPTCQTVSVVIPAYRGGTGLAETIREVCELPEFATTGVLTGEIAEVIVVCDNPNLITADATSIEQVGDLDPRVRLVWFSKNYGQHAATVAGIASSNGDWIVTMDEDGQHDPAYIPAMLRQAFATNSSLVYASPSGAPPHSALRNAASRGAKRVFRAITGVQATFHSFRVMEGSVARAVAAYAGPDVYLDIALLWALNNPSECPVPMRDENSASGYNYRSLASHFWRLVLSSGTRPLRLIAALGFFVAAVGIVLAIYVVIGKLSGTLDSPGWASLMIALLLVGGALLIAIAILAEYVGYGVRIAMGKPLYVIAEAPARRALMQVQPPTGPGLPSD